MDRRSLCRLIAASPLLAAGAARAQAGKVARVAWVALDPPNPDGAQLVNFRRGMRDRGWVEGRNLEIATWWGHGYADRVKALVPDLRASRPDVVVATPGPTLRPLVEGGLSLPTVFTMSGDPVAAGAVASYARPGGTVTGISFFMAELTAKRIALLREMQPRTKRIAFVGWSRHAGEPTEVRISLEEAAKAGLDALYRPANSAAEIDAAYEEFAQWRADAVLAFADSVTLGSAARMAEHSRRLRMPTASAWAEFVHAGNLFSFGPNRDAAYAHLASFVDRILKGAKPGDLPVEVPATVELVINQVTAREFGIRVPPALMARANQFVG